VDVWPLWPTTGPPKKPKTALIGRNFYKVEKWSRELRPQIENHLRSRRAFHFIVLLPGLQRQERSSQPGWPYCGRRRQLRACLACPKPNGRPAACRTALQAIWEKRTVQSDGRLTGIFRLPIPFVNGNRCFRIIRDRRRQRKAPAWGDRGLKDGRRRLDKKPPRKGPAEM
jgi:hypothetical protein